MNLTFADAKYRAVAYLPWIPNSFNGTVTSAAATLENFLDDLMTILWIDEDNILIFIQSID